MKKKRNTPKQATPARLLISIEEHIVNALMLYLLEAKAPKAVLDLFNNLVTLYTFMHHSSPESDRQIQDALFNAMRNMDAINAPVHGPYGEIER
jgi:hypothetical protein